MGVGVRMWVQARVQVWVCGRMALHDIYFQASCSLWVGVRMWVQTRVQVWLWAHGLARCIFFSNSWLIEFISVHALSV